MNYLPLLFRNQQNIKIVTKTLTLNLNPSTNHDSNCAPNKLTKYQKGKTSRLFISN